MEFLIIGLAVGAVILIAQSLSQIKAMKEQITLLKWQIEKLRAEIFSEKRGDSAAQAEPAKASPVTAETAKAEPAQAEVTPLASITVTTGDEAQPPVAMAQPTEQEPVVEVAVPSILDVPPIPAVALVVVQEPDSVEVEQKMELVEEKPVVVPDMPIMPPPIPAPAMAMQGVREAAKETKKEEKRDFEKLIGENLLGKVGVLILLVGMGFFMKYAIDWLGDGMRAAVGYMVAGVLGLLGWRMAKEMKVFSSVLYGGAMGVIYVTTAIARYMYDVYPWWVAIVILAGTMLGMAFMSLHYNRRELAILAVVGGFCAPFIVNNWVDGGALLSYVALLNVGAFVVSMRKSWWELPLLAFVLTHVVIIRVSVIGMNDYLFWAFVAAFYVMFQLMFRRFAKMENPAWRDFFLVALNLGGVVSLLYGLTTNIVVLGYELSGAMAAFLGCVNLVLFVMDWRSMSAEARSGTSNMATIFLVNAVLYLTLAVPMQFDGDVIVLMWSAEMAVLYWWALRTRRDFERVLYVGLCVICVVSFMLNMAGGSHYGGVLWQNGLFWTGCFTLAVWVGIAFWADKIRERLTDEAHGFLACDAIRTFQILVPVLLVYVFVNSVMGGQIYYEQVSTWMALFLMSYMLGLFVLLRVRYPMASKLRGVYMAGAVLMFLFMIGSNGKGHADWAVALYHVLAAAYVWILTRDVLRLADLPADVRRVFVVALNVSIIVWCESLTIYIWRLVDGTQVNATMTIVLAGIAVGQVVLGVVKKQYLVRVIGLVVFCVTVAKLLLVDLWLMSPTGRIVSFVILGVVLIAVSFIYQKIKTLLQKDDE